MRRLFHIILMRSSSSTGVTLVELMVSLVVFSIGVLAIMAMTIMSIKGNSLANRMTQANFLAQDKMEELLSQDVASLSGSSDTPGNYARSWAVALNDPIDPTDSSQWITVTVTWTDTNGDHQMRLKSYTREP